MADLKSKDAVARAAVWFVLHRDDCPRPVIPALREKFGLRPKDAVAALKTAEKLRCPAHGGASE